MGVFDTIKETINGIFAVSGDGCVRRKSTSSLDIEIYEAMHEKRGNELCLKLSFRKWEA